MTALSLAACSGKLPLFYGETLCDVAHPCNEGFRCADSICVVDDRVAPTPDDGVERPDGDFEGPGGTIDPTTLCRSNVDCPSNQDCIRGVCVIDPCSGATIPPGQTCRADCIPLPTACDGVVCADNLERCIGGQCVPSCASDPCDEPTYCDPAVDEFCDAPGVCANGTFCYSGRCYAQTFECGPSGDLYCGEGTLCTLRFSEPTACDELSCAPGYSCLVTTDGSCNAANQAGGTLANCCPNECTAVACQPGETCISGTCTDQCAFIRCEDGGRLCDEPGAVCCNGSCCPAGEECRIIDPSRPGVCAPAGNDCNPGCGPGTICVSGSCVCNTYPSPGNCTAGSQCCVPEANDITGTCNNPCSPNPCSGANPICNVDCTQPGGYSCSNNCTTCGTANTICTPQTGACVCPSAGPGDTNVACTGNTCCVTDPSPTAGDYMCDDPCDPNPCIGNAAGSRCTRDCTRPEGFTCSDPCNGFSCPIPGTTCVANGNTASCQCADGSNCSGSTNCCVSGTCDDPCSPNPCRAPDGTPTACTRACGTTLGYTCNNPCEGRTCNGEFACNPANGNCMCDNPNTNPPTYANCGSGTCCGPNGCFNPCTTNPCGAGLRCSVNCNAPDGTGRTCTNPCDPNTCGGDTQQANPDCRPTGSGTSTGRQCYCSDANNAVCGAGTCCDRDNDRCNQPCGAGIGPTNPCPNDPGTTTNPNNTQCNVNCLDSNDYTCSNPCNNNNCATASGTRGRNPDCRPDPDVDDRGRRECWCAASNRQCTGDECCLGSGTGCADPCLNNGSCGNTGTCVRNCTVASGHTCTPKCTGSTCTNPAAPTCDPTTGNCSCGGATCNTAGGECCIGNACDDPCSPNPCGTTGVCTRNCAIPAGYTCQSQCNGVTCPTNNPTCDPLETNPTLRCDCGGNDTCTNAECCVGGTTCGDPCAEGDPCTTGTNTKCTRNCNNTNGFVCSNPCSGLGCGTSTNVNNPQCRPTGAKGDTAECWCAADNGICGANECCLGSGCEDPCNDPVNGDPCNGSTTALTGKCFRDCTRAGGYVCQPQTCPSTCSSPTACDPKTGLCNCGAAPLPSNCEAATVHLENNGKNVCCDGSAPGVGDATCRAPACVIGRCERTSGTGTCTCDPCGGCTGTGETQCRPF